MSGFLMAGCASRTTASLGDPASRRSPTSPPTSTVSYTACLPHQSSQYCVLPNLVVQFKPSVTSKQIASFPQSILSTKLIVQEYAGISFTLDYADKRLLITWPTRGAPESTQDSLRALLQSSEEVASVSP